MIMQAALPPYLIFTALSIGKRVERLLPINMPALMHFVGEVYLIHALVMTTMHVDGISLTHGSNP